MYLVLLADGFEEIEALAFVDILRRAQVDVKTVSITTDKVVYGSHKIPVIADFTYSELNEISIDGAILPGGLPGTYNLAESEFVKELIVMLNENKKLIGAICAAPSALAQFGVLDGKRATSYPDFQDKLCGAIVEKNERVVVDGNIITSQGAGSAHEFAFEFVSIIKNQEVADTIEKSMLYK